MSHRDPFGIKSGPPTLIKTPNLPINPISKSLYTPIRHNRIIQNAHNRNTKIKFTTSANIRNHSYDKRKYLDFKSRVISLAPCTNHKMKHSVQINSTLSHSIRKDYYTIFTILTSMRTSSGNQYSNPPYRKQTSLNDNTTINCICYKKYRKN